jgi:hypothetical protein
MIRAMATGGTVGVYINVFIVWPMALEILANVGRA